MARRISSTNSSKNRDKWFLTVKTSNKGWFSGTGTDANISVIIYDQSGAKSPVIKLKNEPKMFESGKEDKFKFTTDSMTSIQKVPYN